MKIEDKIEKYLSYVEESIVSRLAIAGAETAVGMVVRKISQRKYNKQRIEDLEYEKRLLRDKIRDTDDEKLKSSLRRRIGSINQRIDTINKR
jgi:hypothetical protein